MTAIAEHADELAQELVRRVVHLGWTPFRPLDSPAATSHIVSLRHPTHDAVEVQRLLAEAGVVVSSGGGGIRVSLHHYNDSSDVTALVETLSGIHDR